MAKNIALLLLAATAAITGITQLTPSENASTTLQQNTDTFLTPKTETTTLTAPNLEKEESSPKVHDPCESMNYVSEPIFNAMLCKFENTAKSNEKSHDMLKELQKSSGGLLTSYQAVKVLKHGGCFVEDKIHIFKTLKHHIVYLKSDDIINLLLSTGGEPEEKLRFLKLLVPYIKDPIEENKSLIAGTFYGEENQEEAQSILVAARGVNCVWGGVNEKTVTFIVDDSGSMQEKFVLEGKTVTRLEYIKRTLKDVLTELKPYQKFNIVRFDTTAQKWMKQHVLPTSDNIAKAVGFIDGLKANGGTNISASLEQAFKTNDDLKAIYLLSDGYPSYGIKDSKKMAAYVQKLQKQKAIPINTISFMMGDNIDTKEITQSKEFLQIIAEESNGSFKQIL